MGPPLAFIVIPFADDFDDVYEKLIRQPLVALGFEVRRADSLVHQRSVLQDVVVGIVDADLVIADVTGLNGNVMYELGLAHALGKATVIITRNIDELPFDLKPYRGNAYSTRFGEAEKLTETIRNIAQGVLSGEAQFSNPIQDFAPHALSASGPGGAPAEARGSSEGNRPQSEGDTELLEDGEHGGDDDDPGPGLLEQVEALEAASEATVDASTQIAELMRSIGAKFTEHTERLSQVQKNLGAKGARPVMLRVFREAAQDLLQFSADLEPLNQQLSSAVGAVAVSANVIAIHRDVNTDTNREIAADEVRALTDAEDTMVSVYIATASFSEQLASLPHMEATLSKAARRSARSVNATAEIIERAQSEFSRARALLDERLGQATT